MEIDKGDYFVILGKSGAGKSLFLELLAGIIPSNRGTIELNKKDITHKKVQKRKLGLVFQDFALFPHLNVGENIAYSLKSNGHNKPDIEKEVQKYALLTGVEHLLKRYPPKLSGGEQQRVALARTLASKPHCLLLDEPLASMDVQLKDELRELLHKINESGITILHVTHDYEEAVALANKVAIMHDGEIIQKGLLNEVFQNPQNEFVAWFTGVKNFFNARLISNKEAQINDEVLFRVLATKDTGNVRLLIENKHIILSKDKIESSAANNFKGIITRIQTKPDGYEVLVDIGIVLSVIITSESKEKYGFDINQEVWLFFKASEVRVLY
ncbi:MAG: ABC transporter ATP-binding protein [Chloroflexia bacterium]|nr:ABC transporter ATP-binding protein [Chloroflexia bacterium]